MDPQQELFSYLLVELKKLGYDVYDGYLPPDKTPYPFIYLANSQMTDDRSMKDAVFATVNQTVHVWHNTPRQRGTVSNMLLDIKRVAYSAKSTGTFKWRLTNVNQTILNDDTTSEPLLHGVIELEFKLTGGIQ